MDLTAKAGQKTAVLIVRHWRVVAADSKGGGGGGDGGGKWDNSLLFFCHHCGLCFCYDVEYVDLSTLVRAHSSFRILTGYKTADVAEWLDQCFK
jgi:hypothetical protein